MHNFCIPSSFAGPIRLSAEPNRHIMSYGLMLRIMSSFFIYFGHNVFNYILLVSLHGMGSLADLMPAAAWSALEADVAELQRAINDDQFAEELRTRKVSSYKTHLLVPVRLL